MYKFVNPAASIALLKFLRGHNNYLLTKENPDYSILLLSRASEERAFAFERILQSYFLVNTIALSYYKPDGSDEITSNLHYDQVIQIEKGNAITKLSDLTCNIILSPNDNHQPVYDFLLYNKTIRFIAQVTLSHPHEKFPHTKNTYSSVTDKKRWEEVSLSFK